MATLKEMVIKMFRRVQILKTAKRFFSSNTAQTVKPKRGAYTMQEEKAGLSVGTMVLIGTVGVCGLGIAAVNSEQFKGSALDVWWSEVWSGIQERLEQGVYMPSTEKILPDFPDAPCYGNIPPGTPAPPLLVLDLEKTLIGSVYDAQYGWRHAKRPGLDAFLNALSQYYEIAIISENDMGAVMEVLAKIDPEGKCHKFGNNVLEMKGDVFIKRLDFMNRDLRKIILVDDNPESYAGFESNTLRVKPYTDVTDKSDRVLLDLIPLLQAIVHEQTEYTDFRSVIDHLGTHDAQEAAIEYQLRLSKRKEYEYSKRNRGLGKLLRGNYAHESVELERSSLIPSAASIVGGQGQSAANETAYGGKVNLNLVKEVIDAPAQPAALVAAGVLDKKEPQVKKKGALFSWLDNAAKQNEEYENAKREKMNEIYMKRQTEKMEKLNRERELREQQEWEESLTK